MKPTIGNWYRIQGSDSFEVVAFDEDDGTIELQYFDGTVEEMDIEDWQAAKEAGALEEIEAARRLDRLGRRRPRRRRCARHRRLRQGRRPPPERRQARRPRSVRVVLS